MPATLISPPASGVPPTTTAVIALSSISNPTKDGSEAPERADASTPAIAASPPDST